MKCSLFFFSRFNLSFQESSSIVDGSDEEMDETGWPCFSTIPKATGVLDKKLAASGFTRKDQDEIEMVCLLLMFYEVANDCAFLCLCIE